MHFLKFKNLNGKKSSFLSDILSKRKVVEKLKILKAKQKFEEN